MQEQLHITMDTFEPRADLVIVYNGNFTFVPIDTIIRVSKKGFIASVITSTGTYETLQSMEEILRDLPENQFARIQKSLIISLRHYDRYRTLPITNYYKKELVRKLGCMLEQYYRNMLYRPV